MKVPRLAAMTAALLLEIGLLTLLLALGPSSIGVPVPPLAAAVPAETPTVTAVDPASAPNDLDTVAGQAGWRVVDQQTVRPRDGTRRTSIQQSGEGLRGG